MAPRPWSTLRRRRAANLVALVADLETVGPRATLRNALRRSLADPGLEVVYLRAGSGGWIDEVGETMTAGVVVGGRAVTPIEREGKPIAALVHDPGLLRNPERLRAAIGAASMALDNEAVKAELRAQLHEARAALRRIVEGGDRERRRLERNLHDAAQQRLVGLALTLRLAGRKAAGDPLVAGLLAEAASELDEALVELRELARGIHPAIVTDAGLGGALETLAERPGVPVDLTVQVPGRLPASVEAGAYYVVAEALANANKHAAAGRITVCATVADDKLTVAVSDDGGGGAAANPGSGLEGLVDRISALGGRLIIASEIGHGTTVTAEIPLQGAATPLRDGRRMAALKWIGWDSWEVPGEMYDQLMDEDNFNHAKAVIECAGGADRLTPREAEWNLGYHSAAGTAEWVLEAIATYDGGDVLEEIVALPSMNATRRGVLHDAMRMCATDGALSGDELKRLRDGGERMGIPSDVVDQLEQIVAEEGAIRRRRYELIVAPVLPARS